MAETKDAFVEVQEISKNVELQMESKSSVHFR